MTATQNPSGSAPPVAELLGQAPAASGGAGKPLDAAGAPRVMGLDLSLAATGLSDGIRTWLIKSRGAKDATLDQRGRRLSRLADEIVDSTTAESPDLVLVEGPSFGQARQGGQHDRAGLWWLVVEALITGGYGLHVVEVPPATLKMYATGKGNASKDEVLAQVVRRYPDVDVFENNTADALVLAAMGLRHSGHTIDVLPQQHLRAMAKLAWPVAA